MKDYLDIGDGGQTTFKVSRTSRVEHLINEKLFEDALAEINTILENEDDSVNWNLKGIILDNLNNYDEAVKCFDVSLKLDLSDDVCFNKANCLYRWAKVTFFPEGDYDKALLLIDDAINTLPEDIDSSEFYFLKAEILEGLNLLVDAHKCYLIAYKEFDKLKEFEWQVDYLNNTSDTLFIVTGCDFYNFIPSAGKIVGLLRDEANEHDPDAVAVVVDGATVGYVANSSYTLIDEVNSASDLKDRIVSNQKAEIVFVFLGEYVVAKLL